MNKKQDLQLKLLIFHLILKSLYMTSFFIICLFTYFLNGDGFFNVSLALGESLTSSISTKIVDR